MWIHIRVTGYKGIYNVRTGFVGKQDGELTAKMCGSPQYATVPAQKICGRLQSHFLQTRRDMCCKYVFHLRYLKMWDCCFMHFIVLYLLHCLPEYAPLLAILLKYRANVMGSSYTDIQKYRHNVDIRLDNTCFESEYFSYFSENTKLLSGVMSFISRFDSILCSKSTRLLPSFIIQEGRQYWMIYRGQGFLVAVWLSPSPPPPPLFRQQVISLSQSSCVSPV